MIISIKNGFEKYIKIFIPSSVSYQFSKIGLLKINKQRASKHCSGKCVGNSYFLVIRISYNQIHDLYVVKNRSSLSPKSTITNFFEGLKFYQFFTCLFFFFEEKQ